MADAGDGRAQHLVEHQFQPVIRMQPRAQVRQATGGGDQYCVAFLAEHGGQGGDDLGNPAVQRAGQGRGHALSSAQGPAAGQQRIGRARRLVQRLEQQALAHAPGGHLDRLKAQVLDQPLQHQSGIG